MFFRKTIIGTTFVCDMIENECKLRETERFVYLLQCIKEKFFQAVTLGGGGKLLIIHKYISRDYIHVQYQPRQMFQTAATCHITYREMSATGLNIYRDGSS